MINDRDRPRGGLMLSVRDDYAPMSLTIGLVNASLTDAGEKFCDWKRTVLAKYSQTVASRDICVPQFSGALETLLPLASSIPTRALLLRMNEGWTAYFDNGWRGSDPSPIAMLSKLTAQRSIRVTSSPGRRNPSSAFHSTMYDATIFQIYEGSKSVRSIACADDGGHWVFEQRGAPLPFEDTGAYERPRIHTRFTADMLENYVTRLTGRSPWKEESYLQGDGNFHGVMIEIGGNLPAI
jgi:hypothetical protein